MHVQTQTCIYMHKCIYMRKKSVMYSNIYEFEVIMYCTYSGIRIILYVRHVGEIDAACLHPMHAAHAYIATKYTPHPLYFIAVLNWND